MTFTKLLGRAEYAFVMRLDEHKCRQRRAADAGSAETLEENLLQTVLKRHANLQHHPPNTSQSALVAVDIVTLCDLNKTRA